MHDETDKRCIYDFTTPYYRSNCDKCGQVDCLHEVYREQTDTITRLTEELESVWPVEELKCGCCGISRQVYKTRFPYKIQWTIKDKFLCPVCNKWYCNDCKKICWHCDEYMCRKCSDTFSTDGIEVDIVLCANCSEHINEVVQDIKNSPY